MKDHLLNMQLSGWELNQECMSPLVYYLFFTYTCIYRLYVHSALMQWKKCLHADKLAAGIQGIV